MRREFVIGMDDEAFRVLDAARRAYGASSMDDFILRSLSLAERQAGLIRDGMINVIDGDPEDPTSGFVAIRVRHDDAGEQAESKSQTAAVG